MTLNDLKTGMIVTWRNGIEHAVIRDASTHTYDSKDCMVNFKEKSWNPLNCYNSDFKNKNGFTNFDIVKVEKVSHQYSIFDFDYEREKRELLWEECNRKKLTVSEIEKLLGYKVEIVSEEE